MDAERIDTLSSIISVLVSWFCKVVPMSGPSYSIRFFFAKSYILIDIKSYIVFAADSIDVLECKDSTAKMAHVMLDSSLYVIW